MAEKVSATPVAERMAIGTMSGLIPQNPKHVIGGDDGGLWISYDGGNRWWMCPNLPIAQFYHVSTDDRDPYQVYGGLQDNTNWIGDSEFPGGISADRWENVLFGDGFHALSDPADHDYTYAERPSTSTPRRAAIVCPRSLRTTLELPISCGPSGNPAASRGVRSLVWSVETVVGSQPWSPVMNKTPPSSPPIRSGSRRRTPRSLSRTRPGRCDVRTSSRSPPGS